jgi:hypothetical protein
MGESHDFDTIKALWESFPGDVATDDDAKAQEDFALRTIIDKVAQHATAGMLNQIIHGYYTDVTTGTLYNYDSIGAKNNILGSFFQTALFGLPQGTSEARPDLANINTELKAIIGRVDAKKGGEAASLEESERIKVGAGVVYGIPTDELDGDMVRQYIAFYKMASKMTNLMLLFAQERPYKLGSREKIKIGIKDLILFTSLKLAKVKQELTTQMHKSKVFTVSIDTSQKYGRPDVYDPTTQTYSRNFTVNINWKSFDHLAILTEYYLRRLDIIRDFGFVQIDVRKALFAAIRRMQFVGQRNMPLTEWE